MNLKLFALILFTSTLISLSTSFPQEAKDDELDKMRATLDDLAQPPALSLEVVPVDSSGLNPLKKRKELELQPVIFTFVRKRCSGVDVRNCRVREDFANGWNDEISSLCPQALTKCTVYDDDKCKYPILKDIAWPGIPDLTVPLPPNGLSYINNSIGSYSCV